MADKKISALTAATTPLAGTEVLPIVQSGATVKVAVSDLTAGRAVAVKSVTGDALTDATVANWNSNNGTYGLDIGYLYSSSRIGSMGSAKGIDGTRALTDFGLHGITNLEFFTGYTYRGRFDSSGNFSVNNGNVVIGTSGKGIDFSATSGSGTSELLNDYEEGDWTPTPNSGTFSSAIGKYTKVGRMVTLTFDITVGTGGGTTMTAPIASAITTANGIYTDGQLYGAGTTSPTVVIGGSGSTIYFRSVGSAVGFSAMTLTASATITGTLVYFV